MEKSFGEYGGRQLDIESRVDRVKAHIKQGLSCVVKENDENWLSEFNEGLSHLTWLEEHVRGKEKDYVKLTCNLLYSIIGLRNESNNSYTRNILKELAQDSPLCADLDEIEKNVENDTIENNIHKIGYFALNILGNLEYTLIIPQQLISSTRLHSPETFDVPDSNQKSESTASFQVSAGRDVVLKDIIIAGEVNHYSEIVGNVRELTRDILEKIQDEDIEKKEEIMNLGKEIIERPRPKFGWLGEKVEKFILLTSHVGTIAGVLQKLKTVIGLE